MTPQEKIAMLEDSIEAESGSLSDETVLESIEEWDSLAKLSLISMFYEHFDRELSVGLLNSFVTVGDILAEMHGEEDR